MTDLKACFDVKVPLVQGPMGGVSGPLLVAAVANAGALGVLPIWADSLAIARTLIRETQAKTNKRFAVNLRADLNQTEHIALAIDLGVDTFHLFWGDPSKLAVSILAKNCKFIATVSNVESAQRAIHAGACALVVQGVEAGGHVLSDISLLKLLPEVVAMAGNVPVIAAGGIVDSVDAQTYVDQGASGVLCGSRFVASNESEAHKKYKAAIVAASDNATVRSVCFNLGWPDAPHRTIRNSTYQMWEQAGFPEMGDRPGEGDIVLNTKEGYELPRYMVMPPKEGMTGDILAAAMYAGVGISKIRAIVKAQDIVEEFADGLCF